LAGFFSPIAYAFAKQELFKLNFSTQVSASSIEVWEREISAQMVLSEKKEMHAPYAH